ncbi:hypothetical protein BKA63DRAFT_49413 [Paraphoma chrysanthemicola]|nr:hypothetical protein BKA63DRAFT_49413 [Paraphoma chrysanthemicola]
MPSLVSFRFENPYSLSPSLHQSFSKAPLISMPTIPSQQTMHPQLQPTLYSAFALLCSPTLAHTLTAFVNEGYRSTPLRHPLHWDTEIDDRFPDANSIHKCLGLDGIFAVLYDPQDSSVPIACASMTRWSGDLVTFAAEGESGWEIKTVTTHRDWRGLGLPGLCVDALVQRALRMEDENDRKVQIWLQAVEELNGEFWRKKGWTEIRGYDRPVGHSGSKMGYRLLVMLQEFEKE